MSTCLTKQFNLTNDDFIKYGKFGVPLQINGKRNPKYSNILNFVKRNFKSAKQSKPLTIAQQKIVTNNFHATH